MICINKELLTIEMECSFLMDKNSNTLIKPLGAMNNSGFNGSFDNFKKSARNVKTPATMISDQIIVSVFSSSLVLIK